MDSSTGKEKRGIGADWQKNWGSSIAVKVTAPVLWTLIFVGMLVAILLQHNESNELEALISHEADQLAYVATHSLIQQDINQSVSLKQALEKALKGMKITHGRIHVGSHLISFGKSQGVTAPEKLTRQILYSDGEGGQTARFARMELFHPSLDFIIKHQRKMFLLDIGIPFFVFGLLLAWLIHVIVTRPIFDLVNATRAVSDGDISLRIKTRRTDEFGHLSSFFNQMLDNLQAKQEQLSKAVTEAESANRMKSSFLANMSHEIRTPLTAIIGYSDLLKNETQSEADREDQIESIQRAGRHLLEIINDILDLSKIEAGELMIETLWVSPMEIVKEVEDLVTLRAESKGLKFSVKYEYPLPDLIHTDPTRLRQILLNLCTNAVKFTDEGSVSIRVSFLPLQQLIQFDVTDSGIGINDSELQRLFRPFSQADTSTTRQYGGTGLGLAISKQLAERLGGDINCISHKGIGSKFTLTVATGEILQEGMLVEPPRAQAKTSRGNTPAKKYLQGRVLLAEDTPDNQMLISMYIRRTGAEVTVVENGKLAFDRALAEDFDLILMDMQMPVMDGVTATRRLRDAGYSKPIVALTANALQQDKEECEQAGTDDYLTKPLDMVSFHAVLNRYLRPCGNEVHGSQHDSEQSQEPVSGSISRTESTGNNTGQHETAEYQRLVDRFITQLPDFINELGQQLSKEDWPALQASVRQLKGMGTSFGFEQLIAAAEQVQVNLASGETDHIRQLTHHLIDICKSSIEENGRKISSAG